MWITHVFACVLRKIGVRTCGQVMGRARGICGKPANMCGSFVPAHRSFVRGERPSAKVIHSYAQGFPVMRKVSIFL